MSIATPEVTEDLEYMLDEPPPKCEVISGGHYSFGGIDNAGVKCEKDAAWIVTGKCGTCGNNIHRFICDDHHNQYKGWVFRCAVDHNQVHLNWSPI